MVTPWSIISEVNSRLMIIASAELLTTISSKARQRTSSPSAAATGRIGSPASFLRSSRSSAWTSIMKAWKWTRRLRRICSESWNRSISIDLPRPTPPQM